MLDTAKLYVLDVLDSGEEMILQTLPQTRVTTDRRELPLYSVAEVSLYLHIPERTLRQWLFGRHYKSSDGRKLYSRPLIEPADKAGYMLSFYNLIEAHILKSTRQRDEVPMAAIRDALDYASRDGNTAHPLITAEFVTEGRYLFEERLGQLVNASRQGQLAFPELLSAYLDRIDRDSVHAPMALHPFVPNKPESKVITIKPSVSSGVPTVSGTGISVPILYGRHLAGDSIADLADDYELSEEQVIDAIAYLKTA